MNALLGRISRILLGALAFSVHAAGYATDFSTPVSKGWNLLGNMGATGINASTVFADATNITSVWKWDSQAATWVFYAPSLAANGGLASYAAGKGYRVLESIGPGEGFWLNAAQAFPLTQSGVVPISLEASSLGSGWNLVATADALTPDQLNTKLGGTLSAPSFSTMWSWNSDTNSWYFYAPTLAANGGLSSYVLSKGYQDFGAVTTGGGRGFWLNSNIARSSAFDALFQDVANPINASLTLDASKSVSQLVTSAGATISASAADGTQFTLAIPANALTKDTTITVTPVSAMAGLPLSNGLVAAAQFAPEGLFLERDATLTIVPAKSVPVSNQTFFGYTANGDDLFLMPPATLTSAIEMKIAHFSGVGVGDGISSDRAAILLKRAASHEARLNQEIARYLMEARQQALLGVGDEFPDVGKVSGYFDSYYGLVVRPRVIAASASCTNALLALRTLLSFMRQRALLGVEDAAKYQTDLDTVLQAAATTCAYDAKGAYGQYTLTGTICRLDQPFNLTTGEWIENFYPSSKTAGDMNYTGTTSNGTNVSGSGTYTVGQLESGTPTLQVQSNDCVSFQSFQNCGPVSLTVILTRLDHGC